MSQIIKPTVTDVNILPNPTLLDAFRRIARVLWRNKKSRVGLLLMSVFILVALFGPLISPYPLNDTNFQFMQGASARHWLGTTQNGQDVLTELIYGTRISILVTFAVGLLASLLAMAIGVTAGYLRGWVDEVLSFLTNVFLVLPGLPLLIVIASYSPAKGMLIIILIIGFTSWPWGARVLRSQVVSLRTRDFVVAAVLAGDSMPRILIREILPNMMSLVAANFLGASLAGLLAAVGLEFLGFGDPSTVSWGSMLYWAQNSDAMLNGQWPWIIAPGLCIALFGTAMVLINFGLDELSNPSLGGEYA